MLANWVAHNLTSDEVHSRLTVFLAYLFVFKQKTNCVSRIVASLGLDHINLK